MPDYFKSIAGSCQPCKQTAVGLSVGLIVAALVFVVIVWKCVFTRLGKWARRRVRAFGKTMFVFVQIVVTLPGIIQLPMLPIFFDLLKILKIPALDLLLENLGLACVVDTDHFLQLMAMTILPPVLVLLVFCRNLIVAGFKARGAAEMTVGPALVIVYAVFPISAATIFNTFMTESFDDGNERLAYDLSFDVTDHRYDPMVKYALVMVFVYPIGVPFLFATILFVNRRALRDKTRGVDDELVRHSNPTLDKFAILFDVYKPEKWWWEVYESLRRVLTTGVLVLIDPGSILQLNVGLALCLQGLVMYSYHRPYEEALENSLAIGMQLETFLTVYVALLGLLREAGFAPEEEQTFGVLLTVTTVLCLLLGLGIVTVATCKLNSREPWVVALRRAVSMKGPASAAAAASAPTSAPAYANDAAAATDAMGLQMDPQNPAKVIDLETGGSSAAESQLEIVKRLKAKNSLLRQKLDRLEADKRKGQQHNKDLKQANKVLRLQREKASLQHEVEQRRLGPQPGNEGGLTALIERPASAEDIERRANTKSQLHSASSRR